MLMLPKRRLIPEPAVPFFFLAGPTTGAPDWQSCAYTLLKSHYKPKGFAAALPCRYEPDHPLHAEVIPGDVESTPRQKPWEDERLEWAGLPPARGGHPRGCILFWIPMQSVPRPEKQGAYARDTKREMGRWSMALQMDPEVRVVVGFEPELLNNKPFGLDQHTRDFERAYEKNGKGDHFPFYHSLEDTDTAAIRMAA